VALEAVTPVVAGAPDDIDDQLRACVAYFEEAEEASQESRRLCERDRDYYDGEQWTTEELAVLRKRKQPALTVNKIKGKVEYLRGFERRSRSDPKAFPRTPKEEQLAEAATDALRFVGDQNDFDEVRSNVYESLLIEGTGAVDVTVEQSRNDQSKIVYKRVPYDRLWWDPHSIEKDFSDAKSKGVVIWMDATEAKHKWPDGKAAIEATTSASSFSGSFEDKPRNNIWCDSKRKRVRIVQAHYLWGDDWMVATFTKGGFLEEPMVSPYLNKDGNSASSLIMRSAYVDRDNNRYGDVRSQISLQDEINKRRSKALHLLSVRQTYGNSIALKDTQKAKNELAKPDGHVELNGGAKFGDDFGILPTGDLAQGQIALLQQATQEMHASGPNQALAGKGTEGQSGKAIQAQQLGGSVEIEPGLDDLRQWSRDVYEATWMRIKQFWTDEKWVRVTDDERNLKWVGLNQKVTLAEKLQEMPPEQAQAIAQQMGIQDPQDPRMQEVVEVRNDVSGLDVDIVIEEGPDITTLQSEQFDMLSNLAKSGIGIPPKAIIQASSIRNKDAILDEMEKGAQLPPEVQEKMAAAQEEMKRLSEELNATKQQLEQQTSVLNAAKSDNAIKGAELRLKERELSLKEREMTVKEQDGQVKAMALMQGDGLLEAQKSMADIALTRANTEQTQVETAILIDSTLNPEPAETEAENG
jgi:hypothetical protein